MPAWLIGKILSPFVLMVLMYCITRPASRLVSRKMRDGWLKRLLLIHSERNKRAYAIACFVLVGGLYAGIVWASWPSH